MSTVFRDKLDAVKWMRRLYDILKGSPQSAKEYQSKKELQSKTSNLLPSVGKDELNLFDTKLDDPFDATTGSSIYETVSRSSATIPAVGSFPSLTKPLYPQSVPAPDNKMETAAADSGDGEVLRSKDKKKHVAFKENLVEEMSDKPARRGTSDPTPSNPALKSASRLTTGIRATTSLPEMKPMKPSLSAKSSFDRQ